MLAAGFGRRLRPLTDILPKALCPVGNVALVDLAVAHVRGLTPSVAVNAHAHADRLVAHLDGAGVTVRVERPEPLGTAGAVANLRDWIDGRPVVVHNADAWHGADLARSLAAGWDGERSRLLVVDAGERADFGTWRYAGACLLPWALVRDLQPVPSGLYEVLWRGAEREGALDFAPYGGPWFDCGTPASYLAANLAASGGRSVIGAGARVEGEVVRSVVWPGGVVARGERLVECIRAGRDVTVAAPQRALA